MLLIYATGEVSTRMLAVIGIGQRISDMSDTAWRKHIIKAVEWLEWLLNAMLSKRNELPRLTGEKKVNIIDASGVKQIGVNGKTYRIHMKYDLEKGVMDEAHVSDHHTGESIQHFEAGKDEINICDAGYGSSKQYEKARLVGLDVIFRVNIRTFSIVNESGERISIVDKTANNTELFQIHGYTKADRQPVRIVCIPLPEEKLSQVIKKKTRNAKRKGRNTGKEMLEAAKWMLLATSLDEGWSVDEIYSLYRARWQVELLFKRFKQSLHVSKLRASSKEAAKATVLLWLISWAISEELASLAEERALQGTGRKISPYMRDKLGYLSLVGILNAILWLDALSDSSVIRHLSDHPRKRERQFDNPYSFCSLFP